MDVYIKFVHYNETDSFPGFSFDFIFWYFHQSFTISSTFPSIHPSLQGNMQDPENLSTILNELATQMFDDGIVTWNRVVTFHAFCGFVARFAGLERGMPHAEELVSEVLTGVVVNRLGLWIMAYGGWVGQGILAVCFVIIIIIIIIYVFKIICILEYLYIR